MSGASQVCSLAAADVEAPTRRTAKSFCRLCPGFCAMDVAIEQERVVEVRGDKNDPVTRGYTCIKGLQNPNLLNDRQRITRTMQRQANGALVPVALSDALDDIAARLQAIIAANGPRSVGLFIGTQGWFNAVNSPAVRAFAAALGTPAVFGTMTIDQSAKWVADQRIGVFNGGPQRFDDSDVWMLVGSNPLVSIMGGPSTSGFANLNPVKALRDAKARGLKLIVIDPRRTETAQHADLFLQPRPGEDAVLLAGIVHVILEQNWHDAAFCERYVAGLDVLRTAVSDFTPSAVSARCDVAIEDVIAAARMFAHDARRGRVGTGTGTDMGPHSNVAEHLAQCLNVICGRFLHVGDRIPNPGVLQPFAPRYADVSPPARSWQSGPVTKRLGLGIINGEMMTAELADEMLRGDRDRIRALICIGSNPAVALPDQEKAITALHSLDLLVTIDPRLSATAKLAHYVVAPTLAFERHDHTGFLEGQFQQPYARYAAPLVEPPAGSEVVDDWKVLWEIAARLGVRMQLGGFVAGDGPTPSTEALIAGMLSSSRVPLAEVRRHDKGAIFPFEARVGPARPTHTARLEVAPPDVLAEIAEVAARLQASVTEGTLLLIVRRAREFMNSLLTDAEKSRARIPENPVYLHPATATHRGLKKGDRVTVATSSGRLEAVVEIDDTLRRDAIAMTHCWGKGSDDPTALPEATSRLVSGDSDLQAINGMPVMSAIPATLHRFNVAPARGSLETLGESS